MVAEAKLPPSALEKPLAVIAEFTDYHTFLEALRLRASQLQIALSSDEAAEFSGLPARYIAKLIGVKPVKRIGAKSFGPILGTLAVKCLMVVDEKALARIAMMSDKYGKALPTHNRNLVRSGATHLTLSHRFLRKIARLGGEVRAQRLTPAQRSAAARRAAMARWRGIARKRKIARI